MTSYTEVVELIKRQHIVALFQGKSESGPRSLGNRSLLFDPRNPNGKEIVNNIKKREFFRPFAGTILLDYVHEWFDMKGLKESPYMMYAVQALPHTFDKIPSIIHVDKTCRIQTVTEDQNFHYYNLIKEFYNHTKVPVLFNTSFNLAGEPLVHTLKDAIKTLENSEIEYLFIPEKMELVFIENKR